MDGRMVIEERYFPSLDHVLAHLEEATFDHFKVYDDNGQLVHSGSKAEDSYA
jgi:hypothetical protein